MPASLMPFVDGPVNLSLPSSARNCTETVSLGIQFTMTFHLSRSRSSNTFGKIPVRL